MSTEPEDLLLTNLRVLHDLPTDPRPLVDVRVTDGIVTSISPAAQSRDDAVEKIDFEGRYVMPGLWDHHVHFEQWALAGQHLDLSSTVSAASVVELVRERLATSPPAEGTALLGYGFRDGLWPDEPLKSLLDEIAPHIPVALASQDLHCGWLNSAAIRLLGAVDRPSGLLREGEFAPVMGQLQATTRESLDALVKEAARVAATRGIVGVVELQNCRATEVWATWHAQGANFFRVEGAVYPENLEWAISRGLRTGDPIPGTDGLVTMGPLKVLTDGSLNTRTAYCHDPYPGLVDPMESHGLLVVPPEVLVPLMQRAHDNGIDSTIHAIGDHANSLVLDAFQRTGSRGSIEHAQLLSPEDFPRFAELGVAASVQPVHAVDDRDVADRHWSGRTDRAFAFAGLLKAGANLRLGSDAPVAPLDPWISMAAAVHRSDDDRPSWHPEQEIPAAAALEASTRNGITVREGIPADLVITDLDPLEITSKQLRSMPVHATMLDGRWTWMS